MEAIIFKNSQNQRPLTNYLFIINLRRAIISLATAYEYQYC